MFSRHKPESVAWHEHAGHDDVDGAILLHGILVILCCVVAMHVNY